MRVLDALTHPPFQWTLAKTGHDFVFAPSEIYAEWPLALRPLPVNCTVVPDLPDPSDFDVAIVATREQYGRVAGRIDPARIIFLSHTVLHPWDARFFAKLPAEVEVVYVSDHKRASFGELSRRGRTIRLAVDPEEFRGYTGETAAVLNVTNRYAQQGDRDYPLFCRLTDGLASQVVGHGNEGIAGAYPVRDSCGYPAYDFEQLKRIYREFRCFLNTDPQGRMHLSTLEAMARGMPLVTVPIAELSPYLEHGVNAFVSDDPGELRAALEALLADRELARRVGAAGREVVCEHFPLDRFVEQWNALFAERVEGAAGRRWFRPGAPPASRPDTPRIAINAMSVGGEMTGIGHHTKSLLRALATTGAQQQYLLLTGGEGVAPADERFRRWAQAEGPAWEQLELPELLAEGGVDLYHNPAFGLPVVKRCPYVATVHDCIPRLFPEYAPAWLREFFQDWAPPWLRLADRIICVSEHTRHDVIHLYGVDPERISVVLSVCGRALSSGDR